MSSDGWWMDWHVARSAAHIPPQSPRVEGGFMCDVFVTRPAPASPAPRPQGGAISDRARPMTTGGKQGTATNVVKEPTETLKPLRALRSNGSIFQWFQSQSVPLVVKKGSLSHSMFLFSTRTLPALLSQTTKLLGRLMGLGGRIAPLRGIDSRKGHIRSPMAMGGRQVTAKDSPQSRLG